MSVSFSNQLTPNNYPTNQRAVIDNNFVQSVTLPTGTNIANTGTIDLQQATAYSTTEIVNIQIIIGASTGTKNNGTINAVLQVCTDNATWANSTIFANPLAVATDNNNTGFAQVQANIKLDPGCPRYIRAQATGNEAGGIPTGSLTIQCLF